AARSPPGSAARTAAGGDRWRLRSGHGCGPASLQPSRGHGQCQVNATSGRDNGRLQPGTSAGAHDLEYPMKHSLFVRTSAALFLMLALSTSAYADGTGDRRARNVIVFLADAAGVSTVHAASLYGHGEPLRLHVQQWPHLGLSEMSPVDNWKSDSANGMSQIMTGVK